MSGETKFTMADAGDLEIIQCLLCIHRVHGAYLIECPAFPGGVPDEILSNAFDHRKPHPGDHGIRFEMLEGLKGEAQRPS